MTMAGAANTSHNLMDRLPPVRGEYRENVPLARYTWFRVGGPAEVLYLPRDVEDLREFLRAADSEVPVTVMGVASNLLIRDGGIPGVVIRLRGAFNEIDQIESGIRAGAGALDINVARFAAERGLSGLEFLSGIPGVIGGAVRMNAGAYDAEIKGVLRRAEAIGRNGVRHRVDAAALGFRYRHSDAPSDWIFVSADLAATSGDPARIAARMDEIASARNDSQPIRNRTGGSTFKNPPQKRAWELIDDAGCRGLRIGGAAVSEQHCNFLINTGAATARDLETLGEEVRRRVRDHSGIDLEWEIRRVGVNGDTGKDGQGGVE